ncbi:unnamed protein product [Rhizophagus irregularis]|nr:unnamed protein product [Rhizophagus irregularis]
MNSNNQTTQEYSDLSMYQTENSSAPLHNNNNDSINNLPQQFIDTTIQPTSQICPNNNNAYNATSNSVNGTISDNI